MELAVFNISGNKTDKKVKLNDEIFGIEPNDHAIYMDVKQYMANGRQGTHKTRERSEIRGSTKKIKRQKGTGTARFGDIKNPIFRGGGRTFGPRPKDYNFRIPRKMKDLARRSALSYKAQENNITVVEDFSFDNPKTKGFVELMTNLEITGKKILMILHEPDENILLASRNIQKAKIRNTMVLNTYEILEAQNIVISEASLKKLEEHFLATSKAKSDS